MLLLMHALDVFTSAVVFKNYYSTINPFLFLRDFFGLLVIIGVALAVHRRFIRKAPRPATSPINVYTIVIFAAILMSGIVLEGAKIMSHSVFQDMVEEYAGLQEQSSLKALEAYWVRNFRLVSPEATSLPFDSALLAEGKTIHEINCKQCHSQPQWAFMGYGASRVMTPTAAYLDRTNVLTTLYYLHFLICLFGLAYLPFSKVIHIVVSPLSLLANSVMDRRTSDPANIATRQIMELDACTHCGACTKECSLSFIHLIIPNTNIMPSEKIASIRTLAKGKDLGIRQFMLIQEGLNLCTNCNQCTLVCPVGINLQDLWFSVREGLFLKDIPEFMLLSPLSFHRGMMKKSNRSGSLRKADLPGQGGHLK